MTLQRDGWLHFMNLVALFGRVQAGNCSRKDRLGLQEPKSWHSARADAKSCTWDRQTPWLLAQPKEQLCREGPAEVWLSWSHSTALQQGELRDGPTAAQPRVQFHSSLRAQHQGGICQYRTGIRKLGVSSVKGHQASHRLEHSPWENWGCWAPSACRRNSFGMRTKIAACCYLQACSQENRPRLFSELQGRRKKELKKTNVKSC